MTIVTITYVASVSNIPARAMAMQPFSSTPVSTIQWAGHAWDVTDYTSQQFTSNNVWVDSSGRLHMKLIYDGQWHDFNLIQRDAAHYGTYKWTVATDVDYIQDRQNGGNPYFLFSPFLFDNSNSGQNNGEIDIELCKWGADNSNTDWTIHPANHLVRSEHVVGAGNTWTLEWMPDHIKFSVEGPSQPYREYVFTDASQISRDTGGMRHILTIGQFQKAAPPGNVPYYEAEVVLTGYTYTPYNAALSAPKDGLIGIQTPSTKPWSAAISMDMPLGMSAKSIQWPKTALDTQASACQAFPTNNLWAGSSGPFSTNLKWPTTRFQFGTAG